MTGKWPTIVELPDPRKDPWGALAWLMSHNNLVEPSEPRVLAEGFAQVDADGIIKGNFWDDDSYFRVYREQPEMPSRRVRIVEA